MECFCGPIGNATISNGGCVIISAFCLVRPVLQIIFANYICKLYLKPKTLELGNAGLEMLSTSVRNDTCFCWAHPLSQIIFEFIEIALDTAAMSRAMRDPK